MKAFISHSSKDKMFVRTLKEGLQLNSIDTWVDEDEIELGDTLISKLEKGLDNSSHLVIVLSPASINSPWVKFELERALSNERTGLTAKIIPIKYRDCEMPDSLSELLYADLSKEVVLPNGNGVKFISHGYESFFLNLVKAIRNSSKAFSHNEKTEIINTIKASEEEIGKMVSKIYRGNYSLIGFQKAALKKYQKKIFSKLKDKTTIEEIRPILLPPGIQTKFAPKIGDRLILDGGYQFGKSFAHFAGYRNDDISIAIDKRSRDDIELGLYEFHLIEFDEELNTIIFGDEI